MSPKIVDRGADCQQVVLKWAYRYIPAESLDAIKLLPVVTSKKSQSMNFILVSLPKWAADLGVGELSGVCVPAHCIIDGSGERWQRTDWYRACFDMLTSQAEWAYEQVNGPIHSYSYNLPESLLPAFDHAWVNRILLFLRRWTARHIGRDEDDIFGSRPCGRIWLTHDVDYVNKTLALRFKQVAFAGFNILRAMKDKDWSAVKKWLGKQIRFALKAGDYWQFSVICQLERKYGVKSQWNFYGGKGGGWRSPIKWLLDPAYKVKQSRLKNQLAALCTEGHKIGLHQAFHSWRDADLMKEERKRVERAVGEDVTSCRQHWLRFSLAETWKAQEDAGFRLDSTLGFNDRLGFRNAAAICSPAWIHKEKRASRTLQILPMILMDSHLFDYGRMEKDARRRVIDNVLDEIELTGGEASIIWHQRVFHDDYGWGEEYAYLLEQVSLRGLV